MENSFEQHYRQLIKKAVEHWEEKGDLSEIERDPVVRLLFSALAFQSHSISRDIAVFQEQVVTEFRNKLIPYHIIKPFPAYSIIQTKIKENKDSLEPMTSFVVDEKCVFEFGKIVSKFTPLLKTKIINAEISEVTDRKSVV